MRRSVLFGLCVAALVLCVYLPQPCEAKWTSLVKPIISKLAKLSSGWTKTTVNLLGRVCHFSVTRISSEGTRYYRARVSCRGWTLTGSATMKTRTSSVVEAVRKYLHALFSRGFISERNAILWLK